MTAQFIGIGQGANLRANALYLAEEFSAFGVSPGAAVQADTREKLQQAIARALEQGELVVLIGGLGLSPDDITLSTLCEGLGAQAEVHQPSLRRLQDYCRQSGRELPSGAQQAVALPRGAAAFPNDAGLFPGCAVAAGSQCILAFPGDPAELQVMFERYAFPFLGKFTGRALIRRRVGVIGLSQAQTAERLGELLRQQNPRVTLRPGDGELTLRVTAAGQDPAQAAAISAQCVQIIGQRLGSAVYGVDVDSLAQVTAARLREAGAGLALAESGTGGRLHALLEREPGGAAALVWQINASSSKAKVEALGIPLRTLKENGPLSEPVAVAMAAAARKKGGAQLGLGVSVGSEGEGAGVVHIALCDSRNVWVRRLSVNSESRDFVRNVAVSQAFNMVRLYFDSYNEILPGAKPLAELTPKAGFFAMVGAGSAKSPKSRGASGAQEETNLKKRSKKGSGKGFLARFIPMKGDDTREIIRKSIFLVAVLVFIGSITYIGSVYLESANNKKLSGELSGLLGAEDYTPSGDYPSDYLPKFAALYDRNSDIAGWIKIANTQVDYAVVQTKNNSYYERLDFDRKNNNHGVPFVDYRTDQKKPSTNTVIYAHNMNDGQMFGELMNYKSINYYREHPTVQYDSVYREQNYKIVGVFYVTANDPEFLYHSFIDAKDDAEMTWFVNQVRSRSLINTGVDVTTTDKLLTLSTCDYNFKNAAGERVARFVVVGRAVREGEDPNVDVSKATINTNPVMPKEWYEQIARDQAAELKAQQEAASRSAAEQSQQAAASYKNWLTKAEIEQYLADGYSEEDLAYLAEERRTELSQWLSESEMSSMTAEKKLELMNKRKQESMASSYKKWLTSDEIADLSDTEKANLVAERQAYAKQYLTDREISSARDWAAIEKLINEKTQAAAGAQQENRFLTAEEKKLSTEEKNSLIADRTARATAAGVDYTKYDSWAKLKAAIEKAEADNQAAADAAAQAARENRFLTAAEKKLSVGEKEALISQRMDRASAAGVDYNKYDTWAKLEAEIKKAESGGSSSSSSKSESSKSESSKSESSKSESSKSESSKSESSKSESSKSESSKPTPPPENSAASSAAETPSQENTAG